MGCAAVTGKLVQRVARYVWRCRRISPRSGFRCVWMEVPLALPARAVARVSVARAKAAGFTAPAALATVAPARMASRAPRVRQEL
ncbi:hypothetical protein D3C84_1210790 [compost metagenome]